MKEQARKQMEAFGLKGYEDEYPSSLSGGMRQRAAFLRTLCHADILLLDEPFGALDVITRGEMQDWLLSVRKQMNRTVLLVTHDMDEPSIFRPYSGTGCEKGKYGRNLQ